ncbi:MAG: hypothetical protein OXG82_06545 [Gammaproteobacteria bacterium]|nr:hypothetical protein [Gammaproteobacteria bacterium]
MRVLAAIAFSVALYVPASSQEPGIYLSMEGRLMESGLRFSPGGETRYRVSDYMQQLWMAATAQTLAARGEAAGCSSLGWGEEEARFDCPLGHDDYIFTFTYDPWEGASVLRVYDAGTEAYIGPDQVEDLIWELPGADDQEALDRAEIDHIAVTVDMKAVFRSGRSRSLQALGTADSVNDTIDYAGRTLGDLLKQVGRGIGSRLDTLEVRLTCRIELKDGQVFEHRYAMPPADPETLFTDIWPSHVSEARWTLSSQYEARQLKALQMFRRQARPGG